MTLSSQLNNILNRENVLKLFSSKKIKEDFEMLYPAKVFKISTATQAKELLEKVAGCKKGQKHNFWDKCQIT